MAGLLAAPTVPSTLLSALSPQASSLDATCLAAADADPSLTRKAVEAACLAKKFSAGILSISPVIYRSSLT